MKRQRLITAADDFAAAPEFTRDALRRAQRRMYSGGSFRAEADHRRSEQIRWRERIREKQAAGTLDSKKKFNPSNPDELFCGREPVELKPYAQIPREIQVVTDINECDKLLWTVLQRFASDSRLAFPTEETLAAELETTDRTIRRALAHLAERGYIEIYTTIRYHKRMNCYFLNLEDGRVKLG